MKRVITILSVSLFLLIFIIFLAVNLFVNIQGKPILIKEIEKNIGRKTSIQALSLHFPFNLHIKKLEINGMFKADDIYIKPSLIGFMLGKLIFNEWQMIKPSIYLERNADGNLLAFFPFKKEDLSKDKSLIRSRTKIFSTVRNLKLVNGQITYVDKKIKTDGLTIKIKDLDIDIQNIFALPYSVITRFQVKGAVPWGGGAQKEGSLSFVGWVDLNKKDGRAELKIDNIDGIYLYPYYDEIVSLEKTNIEKGTLHFSSNMTATNNNLVAECYLELAELVFRETSPTEEQPKFNEKRISGLLSMFKTDTDKVVLNFPIRTRLDKPSFGIGNIRMAVDEKFSENHKNGFKAEDVFRVPAKVMAGAVEGTAEVSKAFVSGATTLGLEIKKALEAAFKREQKEVKEKEEDGR